MAGAARGGGEEEGGEEGLGVGGGGVGEGAFRAGDGDGVVGRSGRGIRDGGKEPGPFRKSGWVIGACIVGKSTLGSLQRQEIDESIKGAIADVGPGLGWSLFHVYFLHVHDRKAATAALTARTCKLGARRIFSGPLYLRLVNARQPCLAVLSNGYECSDLAQHSAVSKYSALPPLYSHCIS